MFKRYLSLFLAFACVLGLFSFGGIRAVEAQAGSGIPDILFYEENSGASAFQISTAEGLQKFSQLGQSYDFAGKTIYMICDINMSGFSYQPPVKFAGTFDGGFHAITQLTVSTSEANCGFVGMLTVGGVIRNLGIEGGVFTATCSKDSWRAGSLVGIMDRSTVENCWSSSTVTISGGYDYLAVGGIAGGIHNGGVIKNCYFAGIATGIKVAAGICGWGQGHYEGFVGQIYNCFNMGQLVASETKFPIGRYSGKILEENKPKAMFNNFYFDSSYAGYDWSEGDTLVSKYHLGDGHLAYVLDRDSALGGAPVWSQGALFPELRKTAGVYPLTVTYNAKGKTSSATLYFNAGDTYTIGVPDSVSVSLSANAGTVNGRSFLMPSKAASLTVTVDAANIADYSSFPNESIYVVTNQAGFAAMATAVNGGNTFSGKSFYMLGNINMNNVSHTPIGQFVSNTSWTKSFSGKFYGNNFKVLNLKVSNTSLNGGGLFGSCYKAYFNGLHIFNGSVTVANRAGGITGYSDGCTFEYCSNGAAIKATTGKDGIGGIAGVARISSVFNYCCNFGTVTATVSGAAGVAGWGQDNIKMTGCYNVGKVTATSDVAALARVKAGYVPEFKDCYYLATSCSATVAGTSASLQRFQSGIVGSYINTSYRSTKSNGAYTNTPAIPAICGENQQPAICTRLYAYEDGLSLGYQTICANLGDEIPYTNQLNYYSTEAFSAPDALTSYAYPIGFPFSISYVTNGGSWTGTVASSYTRRIGVGLPDETQIRKEGYRFAGWFESSACTGQPLAVINPGSTGNKTVYAKWAAPVVINTVADYLAFANAVNSGNSYSDKYVTIAADLDFGGQSIPAIGTESAPFCGVLDGEGHILKNFTIQGGDAQGIVGYLKEGTVKFLRVEAATVSGKTNTGSVVGVNDKGLILGCLSSAEVKSTWTTFDYSLMSQNVRYGNDASPNSTNERIPRMKTFLQNYAPDIIGFQEYDATWKGVVESVLTGYGKQCVFGNTSAQNAGSPLYWNSNKFVALEKGTFWLSQTPDVMSLGWGAEHYRTCSFAVLRVKDQDMLVIAANTHLDHKVDASRINGMRLIMERMNALKEKYEAKGHQEIYFHITGDFNASPSHAVIKELSTTLTEARYAAVSLGTPVNQNTFSAYNATPTSLIDYMFVSNNTDVMTYKVALDKVGGNAISDHYGLHATLRIGGNSHGGIAGQNDGVILSCGYTGTITTKGGSAGIAAENNGNILNSYGQYSSTATGVFANGITTKYNRGQVNFSIYDPNCGMAGAGTTVSNLKGANVPGKLNRLLSLWVRKDGINNGLPFICRAHEFVYKDKGDGTH
ncbi:MAG: InlB B-repeat-containing protein, partial [Oscillospiraceae bacterium]|nr:InlB B-repeat-containing protein [Oscillospiraceae bacterium]